MIRLLCFAVGMGGSLWGASATITVNAASAQTQFTPWRVFGINTASWIAPADQTAAKAKVQAAGNYFLRFPGGSLSDTYHWNSSGVWDAAFHWSPSNSVFLPGFLCNLRFRGTNGGSDLSMLNDNNAASAWISNAETDFPAAQWAYLDLGSAVNVSRVDLIWGLPFASSFKIQAWNPGASNQWSPYSDSTYNWMDLTPAWASTGGAQSVTFSATSTRYVRVLMLSSSAGAAGQYSIAEFKVFNGLSAVSVSAPTAGAQSKGEVSSTDEAGNQGSGYWSPGFDFGAFMAYCASFSPAAEPLITVNFGSGTPAEAAAWVHYANVVMGYGIKYWEIGNELDGDWEAGGPLAASDYTRRYIKFYDAMKAEDPSILITGPVVSQPYNLSNQYDGATYIQAFATRLAGAGKGAYANVIDYHSYPYWTNTSAATSLATPFSVYPQLAADMATWLAPLPGGGAALPVYMTEYNSGDAKILTTKLVNGLWLGAWLGEFIKSFGLRAGGFMWDALNGGNSTTVAAGGDHNYLQAESGPYQFQERAHYWAMQMMATLWAMPGSKTPHNLMASGTDQAMLRPYACLRPDGALTLLLVNLDPGVTFSANIAISGFAPQIPSSKWTFDSSNYVWSTATLPYHASVDTPPTLSAVAAPAANFSVSIPPYSLTLYKFGALPPTPTFSITPTPSISPTHTISPTFTISPTPGPPAGKVTLYPNPVRPGLGQKLFFGPLGAGVRVRIFNMIGELVYERVLSGNPADDNWNGVNSNGVTVVTGIYLLTASNDPGVYRVAVLGN